MRSKALAKRCQNPEPITTPSREHHSLTSRNTGRRTGSTSIEGPELNQTNIVGSYPPNAWGLQDMHGNVWEWCADWFGRHLSGGTDPTGPATSDNSLKRAQRVQRGGAWSSSADRCRAAYREALEPAEGFSDMGFRPALVPYR